MTRFVTQAMHAYIDYPVAIGLIVMPYLLGLGQSNPLAMWLSVVTGIAALVLTLITNHETGVVKIIPYKIHLAVDFAVGVVFVLAPFVMGFAGLDFGYFIAIGLTVLAVVSLHKPQMAQLTAS
jgi:hypothetical protein